MTHYIPFEEIKNLSVKESVDLIKKTEKKKIESLRLTDLIFENQSQIGVYIFFNANDIPVYVGKTGSRAILERVASHFDLRSGAFMNNFLCALAGKNKGNKTDKTTDSDILNVYSAALKHKMIFIGIPEKSLINRFERVIANELKPSLNQLTGVREYDINCRIVNLV